MDSQFAKTSSFAYNPFHTISMPNSTSKINVQNQEENPYYKTSYSNNSNLIYYKSERAKSKANTMNTISLEDKIK
eukprot:CAMPEP_0170539872 /NCGR_PEP_ID=MMETSP0209-20121228/104274_1 /TAXON_ID=665100 ORGANISM="Litonotus pictus, Strain P1" /NCGR_SAMPLE_ID=MMETSP0209 /ASSEMBLY_ACC=CAM_ASM_000301 /LENGTH=74 /DNA_ID=CAMNT_0010842053 /DNA_START=668 /DNA_END=889 /DNA_ORIENTATION=-